MWRAGRCRHGVLWRMRLTRVVGPRASARLRRTHPPAPPPTPNLPRASADRVALECWNCGTPNSPSRTFCVDCGTWIGDSAAAPPLHATTRYRPPARARCRSAVRRRHAAPGRQGAARLVTVASVALAGIVGLDGHLRGHLSGRRSREPAPAAASWSSATPNPTAAPRLPSEQRRLPPPPTPAEPRTRASLGADTATAETDAPASAAPGAEADQASHHGRDSGQRGVTARDQGRRTERRHPQERDAVTRRLGLATARCRLQDPAVANWSLGRVSFRGAGLRARGAPPGPPSVPARRAIDGHGGGVPHFEGPPLVPGVRQPSAGQTTVSLLLSAGIGGNLGLRGYRPNGLQTLKEFSVYPAGRGARGCSSRPRPTSASGCGSRPGPAPAPTAQGRDLPRYQVVAATRIHLPWMCAPVLGPRTPVPAHLHAGPPV